MPDRLDQPAFPAPVEALAPADFVAAWGALELGAYLHLVRCAWTRDPACSLPDDDTALAMMARVGLGEWTATKARLAPALRFADGLVWFDHARRTFDELAARQTRRRAASRQANAARWGGTDETPPSPPRPPLRIRIGSESDPDRSGARSKAGRSESVRRPSVQNDSALSERPDASEQRAESMDAGTLDARESIRRRVLARLAAATFPLAADPKRRALPTRVVDDAATWAATAYLGDTVAPAPMRVDYALERIRDLTRSNPHSNPAALLFAALGTPTQRHRAPRPWDVPLQFAEQWRAKERAMLDAAVRIEAARARQASAMTFPRQESAS